MLVMRESTYTYNGFSGNEEWNFLLPLDSFNGSDEYGILMTRLQLTSYAGSFELRFKDHPVSSMVIMG